MNQEVVRLEFELGEVCPDCLLYIKHHPHCKLELANITYLDGGLRYVCFRLCGNEYSCLTQGTT